MAVGSPDHNLGMFPLKPTQGANQTRYIATASGSIAAGGIGVLTITIPAATRRIFSSIDIACEASVIQDLYIEINDVALFHTMYDKEKYMVFADAGQLVGEAGEVWDFALQNNDTVTRVIRINLVGTDEDA